MKSFLKLILWGFLFFFFFFVQLFFICLLFLFSSFEMGFHSSFHPSWQPFYPRLLSARIIGVHHHGWLSILSLHYVPLNPSFPRFMFEGESLNCFSKKHVLEVEMGSERLGVGHSAD